MKKKYQRCTKTVLDSTADPDITFDEKGISNYYYEFIKKLAIRIPVEEEGKVQLTKLVDKIKKDGKGKKYDCLIGVSGGVDSTYTAWLVRDLGLRPLAVHLDNGWNSELAVKNIEKTLKNLEIDLYTEILDWDVFKDLQISFLKGSTPDGEIPTDHAILATMYKQAAKFGIKYIISGMNFRNEGFLPPTWGRGYLDWRYINGVHKEFGNKSLSSFPRLNFFKFLYLNLFKGIRSISFINYINFNKEEAMNLIEKKLGWEYYGGKHYESIYTRFYQAYILPRKFGIDKRKAHLSCLIMSTGEISREEAIEILEKPIADENLLQNDKEYVIKKLGLSLYEFDEIMSLPIKSINDYPNMYYTEMQFRRYLNYLRRLKIMPN